MAVIGGGNAALCAAIAARHAGASVLLLERAPRAWRGGNSKYTRNLRCAHEGVSETGEDYTEAELAQDLAGVTGAGSDPALTALCIERSRDTPAWMEQNGVLWQPALRGTLQLARTNRFFLGGGKALVNTLYATAERLGVKVAFEHSVEEIEVSGSRCETLVTTTPAGELRIRPRAVVAASGGFEANVEWLREYWGDAADNFYVRGARQNDGTVLRRLLDAGAQPRGNPHGLHAIAIDARGPRFEGGIVTRIDSIPFGIMVNRDAERFYDEGEDLWPKRYAIWGRLIAEQPGQIAWSIFDRQARGGFMTTAFPPHEADDLETLADRCGLPAPALVRTIGAYNRSVQGGTFDPKRLDSCGTSELHPPKSNWARRIDQPPFYAYPVRPGITFTYMGVGVDASAHVTRKSGGVFENVMAAGEIMAGNILQRGYLAGFGMTIGTVFGRIAGEEAASVARA